MQYPKKAIGALKRQAGFTLVEVSIVVAIVFLLLSGVVGANKIISGTKINDEIGELKQIAAAIQKTYATSPSYAGATLTEIIAFKALPDARVVNATTATNRFSGAITTTVATTNTADDTIAYSSSNIPEYECLGIVPQVENAFLRVTVDGADVKPAGATLDRTLLATNCAGASNTIVYYIPK